MARSTKRAGCANDSIHNAAKFVFPPAARSYPFGWLKSRHVTDDHPDELPSSLAEIKAWIKKTSNRQRIIASTLNIETADEFSRIVCNSYALLAEITGRYRELPTPTRNATEFMREIVRLLALIDNLQMSRHRTVRTGNATEPWRRNRDDQLVFWHTTEGEEGYRSHADCRDRWNRENPTESVGEGKSGIEVVKKAIQRARQRLEKSPKK